MTQQQLLDLAKQGDTQAIATLLNRVLQPRGITARAAIKDNYLHLLLDGAEVPNQQAMVAALQPAIANLGLTSVDNLMIYGRQTGQQQAAWSRGMDLPVATDVTAQPTTLPPSAATPAVVATGLAAGAVAASQLTPESNALAAPVPQELPVEATQLETPTRPLEPEAAGSSGFLRNVLLGGLALLVLSMVGLYTSTLAQQKQAIDQAQILSASASSPRTAPDINALKTSEKQLQEAVNLLQFAPALPGLTSARAQEELPKIQAQLEDVQRKLKTEEQALASLRSAQKLRLEAAEIAKRSASLGTKQQAESKLQQAVGLLTTIPQGTFVSAQAQEQLATYQNTYAAASQQVAGSQSQLRQQSPLEQLIRRGRIVIEK